MVTKTLGNRKQRGLTTLSWLVVLAIGGVFLTAAFKLGPLYLDNYFIRAAIHSLENEKAEEMTASEIRRKLSSTFMINNIRDVDAKQIKIEREKERLLVSLNYEKRVNFMANVDFVVIFTNEYDSSKR